MVPEVVSEVADREEPAARLQGGSKRLFKVKHRPVMEAMDREFNVEIGTMGLVQDVEDSIHRVAVHLHHGRRKGTAPNQILQTMREIHMFED